MLLLSACGFTLYSTAQPCCQHFEAKWDVPLFSAHSHSLLWTFSSWSHLSWGCLKITAMPTCGADMSPCELMDYKMDTKLKVSLQNTNKIVIVMTDLWQVTLWLLIFPKYRNTDISVFSLKKSCCIPYQQESWSQTSIPFLHFITLSKLHLVEARLWQNTGFL